MKKRIWILAIMLGVQFTALADTPIYQRLACRDDDPFVFCTQGCKGKDKNWIPMSPESGTWMPAPVPGTYGYCPIATTATCPANVYPYVIFLPWTQTGVEAVYQYMAICPRAHDTGPWEGPGRPESTPYDH